MTEAKQLRDGSTSQAWFRAMADALPIMLWQSGADGLCTYFNKSWLEFTGRAMAQELGEGWAEGIYPADLPGCRDVYRSSFDRREPFEMEYRLRHRSGEYRWVLDRGAPQFGPDGGFLGYLGGAVETHGRKRAEAEIRRGAAWLRSLIDATQDAVVSIDQQARIVLFNPAAERIFGYARNEVVGEKVNMLMAEPYAAEHDGYIEHYEKTGEARAIGRIRAVTAKRKNGELFPIELSVTEIAEDRDVQYAAFIRDTSEKARLQAQLVENERLVAIGTTTAKIGHELANPLNGMSLTIQLLEQRLSQHADALDSRITPIVNRLKNEVSRLSALLEQFRSLSRREKFAFQRTSLTALVGEAIEIEIDRYLEMGIQLECSFPPDLPAVTVDIDKMKQVILNLTKNAAEAMAQGGRISITGSVSGDNLLLEISDTGAGIPAGVDVFEPFFTTKPQGTGIGLAIVRQIVRAHGGSISYRSRPGQGTTFVVALPLK